MEWYCYQVSINMIEKIDELINAMIKDWNDRKQCGCEMCVLKDLIKLKEIING